MLVGVRAAAGDADIKDRLLKGTSIGGKSFKVHLDGYDLGPALRLIGMVGFLISATGLLHLRGVPAEHFSAGAGGILGTLVGKSLL